ncbi:MAG: hypothetical protein CO029_02440 [Candidatus Magasanikbacteria bacterium CG_4_9_14_0_2_um_filter_41_10]|uniref:Uncharacterized protein n=1 Tax=Candidatus Magasanikbacteria bacterium CG_4_10_14_0_2_um_filter_41_31 TaxID=1974639 RepID=A0A2M7V1T2_9BACT|nr:MAG: hypothetical protein AUJ37_03020 [Candidatus Magasanikbacteria bacterium CG1_02_41_34]PIZ92301.1 MAG: hypothetical protein COX83_04575 [Candidatus Magasanikbacteria bacterium CG_4_10_14_0_2_um_filter_41_31]PJC53504.1 MAG: hypothetical protein CO029_02440 [Candidatus Magasanikbacteria bacterium CG_4_9_14_0_2_um_filter_41_10]
MLFSFEVMIMGDACSHRGCIQAITWFVAHLQEKSFTVQKSDFKFHPADESVVLSLSAYGHVPYLEGLIILEDALEAIPGHEPSLVGIYNRTCELSCSFDADREISGWTLERQGIAFDALFVYFKRRSNREIADVLAVGIGTIHRYRASEPRKIHQGTLRQIVASLREMRPRPPQLLIDKFQIMVTSGDDELPEFPY